MRCTKTIHPNYIQFEYYEEYSFDFLISSLKEIVNEAEKNNIFKIFLDMTNVSNLFKDQMDRYNLGLEFAKQFSENFKIAELGKVQDVDYSAETVAKNRNLNVKVFINKQLALKWLL